MLTVVPHAKAVEQGGPVTKREGQFLFGVGYGWGQREGINPLRWDVRMNMGYTAANGAYVGALGDAYDGEMEDFETGYEAVYMLAGALEIGYDLRLAERWALRFALLNGVGALVVEECSLVFPQTEQTCSREYEKRYGIGPSAAALYLWENWLFFSELRQMTFISTSAVISGVTVATGFGLHW